MRPPRLHVLADGRSGVGAGHLGRSLAVAQAWIRARGTATLVEAPASTEWADRYRASGVEVGPPSAPADVLVVDGYRYDDATVTAAAAGAPVVVIDDDGVGHHGRASLVVDQNLGATSVNYDHLAAPVLAGTRYALIRQEVVGWRPSEAPDRTRPPRRIAVAMGGDPAPEVRRSFEEAAATLAERHGLEVVPLQGVRDLGPVLADVDLALTAAGSTVWELALFGVPTVAVVVADNQVPVARRAAAAGLIVDAGDIGSTGAEPLVTSVEDLLAQPDRRAALATAGRAAVDGLGARRVAAAARSLLLELRPVSVADARLLWEWANDAAVRANAFNPEPIPWDDHVAWLDRLLARPDAAAWIASDGDGAALGQVRVEVAADGTGTVDVSVAPERRGQGWAGGLLFAAASRAEHDLGPAGLRRLEAAVLVDNHASARAFVDANFTRTSQGSVGGREHHTYTRPCDG